jgi:aliphatic nitrilase
MLRAHVVTPEDRTLLEDPMMCGGSTIISPSGKIIAGPMGPEEGILYGDIDLEEGMRGKLVHDFAGHYNRADVFQLNVSAMTLPIYNVIPVPSPAVGSLAVSGRGEGAAKVPEPAGSRKDGAL